MMNAQINKEINDISNKIKYLDAHLKLNRKDYKSYIALIKSASRLKKLKRYRDRTLGKISIKA